MVAYLAKNSHPIRTNLLWRSCKTWPCAAVAGAGIPSKAVGREQPVPSRTSRPAAPGTALTPALALGERVLRIEAIGGVEDAHSQLGLVLIDQHADLDLAGGDRLDVDVALGQ